MLGSNILLEGSEVTSSGRRLRILFTCVIDHAAISCFCTLQNHPLVVVSRCRNMTCVAIWERSPVRVQPSSLSSSWYPHCSVIITSPSLDLSMVIFPFRAVTQKARRMDDVSRCSRRRQPHQNMVVKARVRPIELFCVSADTDYLPNRYADISAFTDNLPIYKNICRYNRYLQIQHISADIRGYL